MRGEKSGLQSKLLSVANRFVLLTSEAIVTEINEVLHRPKLQLKLKITPFEARAIVAIIRRDAEFIEIVTAIRKCRDPKDDKFLECAVDGKADYLVSADEDILTLQSILQIPIVDIPTFWQRLF